MSRRIVFLGMIVLGVLAGLAYGWLSPTAVRDNNPLKALRPDFKADYVLMVAEIYDTDADLKMAGERLTQLDTTLPTRQVLDSLVYARNAGYSIDDLDLMTNLLKDLQTTMPIPTEAAP